MTLLIMAFLFGASVFLIFVYFGTGYVESEMIKKRLDDIKTFSNTSESREKLLLAELTRKHKKFVGVDYKFAPLTVVFIIGWLAIGFVAVRALNAPLINVIIILGVVPILVVRISRIIKKRNRVARVMRELPGAMDLMVVCLEAGLSINSALLRVAHEIGDGPFGVELRRTADEVSAGIPLEDALRSFAKRTEVEDVNVVATAIIQAQKMGSSLALTFKVQAESIREKYKVRIKEKIHKVPVKILFPLVFFIFPVLFIVILAPAAISIIRLFTKE